MRTVWVFVNPKGGPNAFGLEGHLAGLDDRAHRALALGRAIRSLGGVDALHVLAIGPIMPELALRESLALGADVAFGQLSGQRLRLSALCGGCCFPLEHASVICVPGGVGPTDDGALAMHLAGRLRWPAVLRVHRVTGALDASAEFGLGVLVRSFQANAPWW